MSPENLILLFSIPKPMKLKWIRDSFVEQWLPFLLSNLGYQVRWQETCYSWSFMTAFSSRQTLGLVLSFGLHHVSWVRFCICFHHCTMWPAFQFSVYFKIIEKYTRLLLQDFVSFPVNLSALGPYILSILFFKHFKICYFIISKYVAQASRHKIRFILIFGE